jgi:hypothetical protein
MLHCCKIIIGRKTKEEECIPRPGGNYVAPGKNKATNMYVREITIPNQKQNVHHAGLYMFNINHIFWLFRTLFTGLTISPLTTLVMFSSQLSED